jgi:hypothetical protein
MKRFISFYSLFLFVHNCFADIPVEKSENIVAEFSNFNYMPWTLGVLGALAILVFAYTYNKEKNETK